MLCLQLHAAVSCSSRLGHWSIITGTLRTNLTGFARFISWMCVSVCAFTTWMWESFPSAGAHYSRRRCSRYEVAAEGWGLILKDWPYQRFPPVHLVDLWSLICHLPSRTCKWDKTKWGRPMLTNVTQRERTNSTIMKINDFKSCRGKKKKTTSALIGFIWRKQGRSHPEACWVSISSTVSKTDPAVCRQTKDLSQFWT